MTEPITEHPYCATLKEVAQKLGSCLTTFPTVAAEETDFEDPIDLFSRCCSILKDEKFCCCDAVRNLLRSQLSWAIERLTELETSVSHPAVLGILRSKRDELADWKRNMPSAAQWVAGQCKKGKYNIVATLAKQWPEFRPNVTVLHATLVDGTGVAIKEFHEKTATYASRVEKLNEEFEMVLQLKNPRIVTYHAIVEDPTNDKCRLFMEHVPVPLTPELYKVGGESLLKTHVRQICEGLLCLQQYSSKQVVMHRDIKPHNLMLTAVPPHGTVKIIDFGFSKPAGRSAEEHTFGGTLYFAAPEMLPQNPDEVLVDKLQTEYNPAVDIWALGITILWLLDNCPWPHGLKPHELVAHIQQEAHQPSPPTSLSLEARDFISSCLQREPTKRPPIESLLKHPWLGGDVDHDPQVG